MPFADALSRFSRRVDDYVRYRPSYPPALIALLRTECGLGEGVPVADLGSGTGILARLLLQAGAEVWGVEPNAEMRAAGERMLKGQSRFHSVAGKAEETGLPNGSVRLVTAGQAFHWFDLPACRRECQRILQPGGYVVLAWNERLVDVSPFLRAYEDLLKRHAPEYEKVDHRRVSSAEMDAFFGAGNWRRAAFPNGQSFEYEGLQGRLLSSSYAPALGTPGCEKMLADLRAAFDQFQVGGKIAFEYSTVAYWGRLDA